MDGLVVGRAVVGSDIMKLVHSKKSVTRYSVFGSRYSVFGCQYSGFGTRDSVLGTYSPISSLTNAWNVARYDTVGSGRRRYSRVGSGRVGSSPT